MKWAAVCDIMMKNQPNQGGRTMKRVWIWMLLLTLMLVPVQAAQPDVEITWNATHTRLDIRGDLGNLFRVFMSILPPVFILDHAD